MLQSGAEVEAGKTAQCLRAAAAPARTQVQFPTHKAANSQPFATPVPGG